MSPWLAVDFLASCRLQGWKKTPRLSSTALQHSQTNEPFFSRSFWRRVCRACPALQKSHPQGLATLSVTLVRSPLETYFSSRHSWASPFKAFLWMKDRKKVSSFSFHSCAFLQNLLGLVLALQRFVPFRPAVLLISHPRFYSGSEPHAFLGFLVSRVFFLTNRSKTCLSFQMPFSLLGSLTFHKV
jgi:hypothetical protein